jgi:hypothetical protein
MHVLIYLPLHNDPTIILLVVLLDLLERYKLLARRLCPTRGVRIRFGGDCIMIDRVIGLFDQGTEEMVSYAAD